MGKKIFVSAARQKILLIKRFIKHNGKYEEMAPKNYLIEDAVTSVNSKYTCTMCKISFKTLAGLRGHEGGNKNPQSTAEREGECLSATPFQ